MPYQLSWYRENYIVLATVSGDFSLAELEAYGNELSQHYLEGAQTPIHVISDVSAMKKFPTHALTAIRTSESWLRHPKLGWVILIDKNSNPMLRFLLATVTQVVKLKYRMVATPEEALSLLYNLDPALLPVEAKN